MSNLYLTLDEVDQVLQGLYEITYPVQERLEDLSYDKDLTERERTIEIPQLKKQLKVIEKLNTKVKKCKQKIIEKKITNDQEGYHKYCKESPFANL